MTTGTTTTTIPTLRRAVSGLLVLGILARVFGLLREILLANYFGVGESLGAIYLGMAVPVAVTVGVGSALSRAAVASGSGLDDGAFAALVELAMRRLALSLAAGTAALAATSPLWLRALPFESMSAEVMELGALLASLALMMGGLGGVAVGFVNARGRHWAGAVTPLVYNAVVCAMVFLGHEHLGAFSFLAGVLLAEASQVFVLAPLLRRGAGVHIDAGAARQARDAMRRLARVFWPAAAAGVLLMVNLPVDRAFAALVGEGAIAALAYADKLVQLPAGLIAVAIATPMITRLSRYRDQGRLEAYERVLALGVRVLVACGALGAAFLAFAARPLIGLLLERGAFDAAAVELCSQAFLGYAVGIPFLATTVLLTGAGLTARKPWAVALAMGVAALVNVAANAALWQPLGVVGIALATSASALVRSLWLGRASSPELLRSAAMWASMGRVAALAFAIAAGLLALDAVVAIDAGDAQGRILLLLLQGGVTLAIIAALWRPVVRAEWQSLLEIRRAAAADREGRRDRG